MQLVTIALALIAAAIILRLKPLQGLVAYLCVLCWYSSWQPVNIGVNLTLSRIVVFFLLLRCLQDATLVRRFRWMPADVFIILLFVCETIAGAMTTPIDTLVQNRGGSFFDIALPYFVIRLVVTSMDDCRYLLKWLLTIAVPLAVLGLFHSLTGYNPWGNLVNDGTLSFSIRDAELAGRRYGFFRARVNFPNHIGFGFFFAAVGSVCLGLKKFLQPREQQGVYWGLALVVVGLMSCVSSGPLLAAVVAGGMILLFPYRRYWKTALLCVVIGLAAIDVLSNRRWYEVLASLVTFNPGTAYYRIYLVQEALSGGMTGHWLMGYGVLSPEKMAESLSHWRHKDIANHFIFHILRFGLLGFLPWTVVVALALRSLYRAFHMQCSVAERWLVWCLAAAVLGALASMMSACWEGQSYTILFAMLALCVSMPRFLGSASTRRWPAGPANSLSGAPGGSRLPTNAP